MRFVLLLSMLLLVSACGKKPNFVDPPVATPADVAADKIDLPADPDQGASTGKHAKRQPGDNYPHLYPKPWL